MMVLHTKDAELVLENQECVAVRMNGRWVAQHPLLGLRCLGSAELCSGRVYLHQQPRIGSFLVFDGGAVTTELVSYTTYQPRAAAASLS